MTDSATHAPPAITSSAAYQPFGITDFLLFTMAVIWGINFVVVKYATHIFNPVAFTGLRVGFALTLIGSLLAEMFASQRSDRESTMRTSSRPCTRMSR